MQGWQYGKGPIYLRPIFRLTKLAFLRASATMKKIYCNGLFQCSSGLEEGLRLMACTNVFNLRTNWSEPQHRDRTANDHKWHLTVTEQGANVSLLLLDLSAAFDKVNHSLLLSRLENSFGWRDRGNCSAVVSFLSVGPISVYRNEWYKNVG